jgi:muramoyltetrapeptide carboxypeptidase
MKIKFEIPIHWPKLKKGDKISLISPSFFIKNSDIIKIKNFLVDWGLEVQIFPYKTPNNEPFLAHCDQERLNELRQAINCKNSDFISATRGGYGASCIIDELLDLEKSPKFKLLTGFSDITSLHLAFNNCFKFSTLHSPTLKQIANNDVNDKTINLFKKILFGEISQLEYEIKPLNQISKIKKMPKLLGGNLSLIQTSIGAKWQINNSGNYAMLIEEVDEEAYKIDRMLNHLKNANIFNNCQAVFIGDLIEKADSKNQYHLNKVVESFANNINIQVFSIKHIGHGQFNTPIPLGVEFEILD